MRGCFALIGLSASLLVAQGCQAASLQVSPVTLDLTAPAQSATLNLRNMGDSPVNVQVRAYHWAQVGGEDQLIPAKDVVASPPAAKLQPGTTYTIRVVRMGPPVVKGEEAYRLMIDELPEVNLRRPANSINVDIRYSIPVFFTAAHGAGADVHWKVARDSSHLTVEGSNTGNRHAKIADLALASPTGTISVGGSGLNGYVLPGSTRRWATTRGMQRIQPGSSVRVTAKGDDYAVNQPVAVEKH
ncbi:molecular chaperone [Phyllobacterium sp. 628]|uniref:fimbrial biogenesis chaperone n=1 Tax=Phyllobacterium sp. 628 TaxID=2718938 RepID=UPI0016622A1A|nr:molecular chaperone [Phyllobacterium sp. 628]QND52802.1 molecular chaperone [Phyllobacterium sp. 628]